MKGSDAFFLYDSLGFPLDLTALMAEEKVRKKMKMMKRCSEIVIVIIRTFLCVCLSSSPSSFPPKGWTVDAQGFAAAMEEQKQRSRNAQKAQKVRDG